MQELKINNHSEFLMAGWDDDEDQYWDDNVSDIDEEDSGVELSDDEDSDDEDENEEEGY